MLHGKDTPKEHRQQVCTRCIELDEELSTLRTEVLEFTTLRTEYAALSARLELVEKEKNTLNRSVRSICVCVYGCKCVRRCLRV